MTKRQRRKKMHLGDFIYLSKKIPENISILFLQGEKEKLESLVNVLHLSNIEQLDQPVLVNLAKHLVFGKYQTTLVYLLCHSKSFQKENPISPIEQDLLDRYNTAGYQNEDAYRDLILHYLKENPLDLDVESILNQELEEKKEIIPIQKDTNISMTTKDEKEAIPICFQMDIHLLGYLVATMSNFPISDKEMQELLQTYYSGLEQSKEDGFMSRQLIIEDKKHLYQYLMKRGFVEDKAQSEKENVLVLKKKN